MTSSCTSHRGTILAVDFAHWGGPIVRGCAVGQRTGYDLLHAAGFTTADDAQDGISFICRIGDKAFHDGVQYPTPSEDPCIQTPPASAYWTYWHALAGHNTWTYSQLGPLADVPKPGEVELWMFGGTNIGGTNGSGVPHLSPSTLRPTAATSPTATPTHTTTTRPATATPRATTRRPAATATATATAASTAAHPAAAEPGKPHVATGRPQHRPGPGRRRAAVPRPASRAVPAAATPKRAGTTRQAVVAALPTHPNPSSGSPAPLVIGICLALALAAAGAWAARRRRRYE